MIFCHGVLFDVVGFLRRPPPPPLRTSNLFKVYIDDMIVAVEATKQGVTMGEDMVSRLMFADDFVGISETPKGFQKEREKTLEYTRKWRVTANVKICAVVVCNEDKVNPVNFRWKWGEDERPIVDQYTYVGVEISKDCSWDAHIAKVIGKDKSQVGKMDVILTDPHLDTRIKRCILINVIVLKLRVCRKNMKREREVRNTAGNCADDSS